MARSDTNRRTDAEARKIAGLPDLLSGMSLAQVAKKHGVSDSTVRRWAAEPEVREALATAKDEAIAELKRMAPRAARALGELFDSEDERVQLQAILAVLDRAGVVKVDKLEVGDDTIALLREMISLRRKARRLSDGEGDDE